MLAGSYLIRGCTAHESPVLTSGMPKEFTECGSSHSTLVMLHHTHFWCSNLNTACRSQALEANVGSPFRLNLRKNWTCSFLFQLKLLFEEESKMAWQCVRTFAPSRRERPVFRDVRLTSEAADGPWLTLRQVIH